MTTWLHEQRLASVQENVLQSGARTVLDLGCGDGDLIMRLAAEPQIKRLVGVDLCADTLDRLRARMADLDERHRTKIELVHGSMFDVWTTGDSFDCAVMLESIEHIDPGRLSVLEQALFARVRPMTIVITTPNAEFNALLGVPPHRFRHPGHRFEWDRAKFRRWSRGVAERHGFHVSHCDIAGNDAALGGASQMATFTLTSQGRVQRSA